jgi:general secretion pathway protein B
MSFILDALKKSETERQQQGSAEFSSVPSSSGKTGPARWLWLLAILLAVNIAVLVGILMKPAASPVAETQSPPAQVASSFEDQVSNAAKELPTARPAPQTIDEPVVRQVAAAPPRVSGRSGNIPTIDQLRLDGTLQLDELHLDIHVYSEKSAERFVFINMDKYREDERIDEGPVVSEITPDGVILEYQGRSFLLPRQ